MGDIYPPEGNAKRGDNEEIDREQVDNEMGPHTKA